MDDRVPKYVQKIVNKLSFLAIPNLGILIGGLAVLAFLAGHFLGTDLTRFIFDPYLVLQGEWHRLFAFPLRGTQHPIWLLFFVMFTYFIVGGLESAWGSGPLTVYVLFGYISVVTGAFITMLPVSIWYYILLNVTFAFGTVFPNVELLLFFFPVKAKWLAMISGGFFLFQFVFAGLLFKVLLLFCVFPYLVFFGPSFIRNIKTWYQVRKNRDRFRKGM